MKFRPTQLWIILAAAATAHAADPIDATRSTLEQWVETKRLVSEEKNAWRTEKAILGETSALLADQVERLKGNLADLADSTSSADAERTALTEERDGLAAGASAISATLAGLETSLRKIIPTLPPPLLQKIQPLVRRLPDDPAKTKLSVGERVQNIVGILNETDKFNNTVTFTSEVRSVSSGREVEVRTLYWGLALAYYVDASGQYAGIGRPSAQGWEWPELPEASARIQKLFAIYDGTADIEFVPAPVRIN